jgi:transposase-like protein
MNNQAKSDIRRKLSVLNYAKEIGNISKACRHYGVCRETYYEWKWRYKKHGESDLLIKNHALKILSFVSQNRLKKKYFIYAKPIILNHSEFAGI